MKRILGTLVTDVLLLLVLILTYLTYYKINDLIDENKFEGMVTMYEAPETNYKPTFMGEYWNLIENPYIKMYYEALVRIGDETPGSGTIYIFKEDIDKFDTYDINRGILYARLDHPELELIDFSFSIKRAKHLPYLAVCFKCKNCDEGKANLYNVQNELKDLISLVDCEENIENKYRIIYDWIVSNVAFSKELSKKSGTYRILGDEYLLHSLSTDSCQNVYGAIVEKKAICDGFSDAYKYICNCCNLECVTIIGQLSLGDHVWNKVELGGKWYLVDVTFGLKKSDYYFIRENLFDRRPYNIGLNNEF